MSPTGATPIDPRRPGTPWILALLGVLLGWGAAAFAAKPAPAEPAEPAAPVFDETLLQAMVWRNIGPFRGGRSTAVTGVAEDELTYYMGTTGGGVWRTEDAGGTWENLSDGQLATGSVGAVAVAPSDANVIWVGMGEACVRGVMTTHGDGVYRSTDRGRTWSHLGLEATLHISSLVVHPDDPDTAWVGAQGHAWGPNEERGVYKTTDGGATWSRTLWVDADTGVSDLVIDTTNPRILYAATWQHRRRPWVIESGGPGSGVWKSTDGGETWERLTEGLPETLGKVGVAVSPADPDRVWAIVEAEEGGLYRSDDAGGSWERINEDRRLQTRSWYYMHVFAHPRDRETVWVLNAPAMRSVDGGRSFERVRTPHGDNHDLWINPRDPRFMINANDGGGNVSVNGGETWSTQSNQPTAQFYRVAVDRLHPYRVYGGQQDNSAVVIQSRSMAGGITERHWESIAGCESASPAFDPDDPRYVYGGCYQGILGEWDAVTKRERSVMAYPYLGLSVAPRETRYRFNWNAPLRVSPHDPGVLYHAGNQVLKSVDRGVNWEEVSPDLTRDEEEHQDHGGAPITSEGAGGEVYNTILSFEVSPHDPRVLWAGSDDGLVHMTRDGGTTWSDVTPPGIGEAMINAIEISAHAPGRVWLAVTWYKWDDLSPGVFLTEDGGASWERRDGDLPDDRIVRVVREDPERRDLLYAGTETGVSVSWDGGRRWQEVGLGLPVVPVTDLVVHRGDLVAATQGRAFWILDDLEPLRGLDETVARSPLHLYAPAIAWLDAGGAAEARGRFGQNPPAGAVIRYLVAEEPEDGDAADTDAADPDVADPDAADPDADDAEEEGPPPVVVEILDSEGRLVRRAASDDEGDDLPGSEPGLNQWVWDLTWQAPAEVEKLVVFGPSSPGVGPGAYTVRLRRGELEVRSGLDVRADPGLEIDPAEWRDQQDLARAIRDGLHRLYDTANRLQEAVGQVETLLERVEGREGEEALREAGEALAESMEELDGELLQRGHTNFQDIINHPARLNGELAFLLASVDSGPPVNVGDRERWAELEGRLAERLERADVLLGGELDAFNALVDERSVPAVLVPAPEPPMPDSAADEPAVPEGSPVEAVGG